MTDHSKCFCNILYIVKHDHIKHFQIIKFDSRPLISLTHLQCGHCDYMRLINADSADETEWLIISSVSTNQNNYGHGDSYSVVLFNIVCCLSYRTSVCTSVGPHKHSLIILKSTVYWSSDVYCNRTMSYSKRRLLSYFIVTVASLFIQTIVPIQLRLNPFALKLLLRNVPISIYRCWSSVLLGTFSLKGISRTLKMDLNPNWTTFLQMNDVSSNSILSTTS